MADDSLDQHADEPAMEKVALVPSLSTPKSTSERSDLHASVVQQPSIKALKAMRGHRWFAVASLFVLVLVLGSLLHALFAPASAPLTVAIVTTLSGSQSSQGREALRGAQLYINAVNQAGGVNGHQIQLLPFDDRFGPQVARSTANQVIMKHPLLLLGPVYSATALPANPLYAAARIPLITASVSADQLTSANPYAFRLRTLTSAQGGTSAIYSRQILGLNTASIVYADEPAYGRPIADAFAHTFVQQGGRIAHALPLAQDPQKRQQTLDAIVATLAQDSSSGLVYLAMTDVHQAGQVLVELRRHGLKIPILCTDAIDSDLFPASVAASYAEERSQPGYFTDGVYASSPVIYDSAPDEAQAFASHYQQVYQGEFGWFAAKYYEAAQVAVAALRAANVKGTPASLDNDRAQILQQLALMDSPQTSVEGLDGPIYFDPHSQSHHDGASPIRFGHFLHGRLRSLPIQLIAVSNPTLTDLPAQERAGEVIKVGDQYFWKQRVVYAGVDINKISSINVNSSTFTADFYLWMRYSGADDVTAIAFTNASNVTFDAAKPLDSQTIDGLHHLHYRLYHVTGDFKAAYDFHEYPFDQQQLNIGFQNTRLTSEHLVYVIDGQGLRLNPYNTYDSKDYNAAASPFQQLSSWLYKSTQYASDTFTSHSTLGDPRLFDLRTRTDYSGLQVTMTIQRRSWGYLLSHLLPLLLLIVLVYLSLFLSIKRLGDRLTVTVSALLASAVLLLSINSELPEIGYVVSLDGIYYAFFLLCLLCIIVPMGMEWLDEKGHNTTLRRTNIGLHVTYLLFVAATVTYYLVTYGNRFV